MLLVCVLPLPSAHEAAGAKGIRRSPRPLRGGKFINASGAWRGEDVNVCLPSLRANGSRERAPDDRLSEAIHTFFAARWIASLRSQ